MIGAARILGRARHALIAAAVAAGIGALPDLGQQRTLSSRPGSGLVRSAGRPKPRRDAARQAAAQAKRERKNVKRIRDFNRCHVMNDARREWPYAKGVSRG